MCFRGPRFSSIYNKKHRHALDCGQACFFFLFLRHSSFRIFCCIFNVDSRFRFAFYALHASRFTLNYFALFIIIIIIIIALLFVSSVQRQLIDTLRYIVICVSFYSFYIRYYIHIYIYQEFDFSQKENHISIFT